MNIALILLAAGLSTRFGDDKLTTLFRGRPLLLHAASALQGRSLTARIAIASPDRPERRDLLEGAGWTVIDNTAPQAGQSSSLKLGVAHAKRAGADGVLVLLGDMPLVPDTHLSELIKSAQAGAQAIMTEANGVLTPPAFFTARLFDTLLALEGDQGAKHVFRDTPGRRTLELDAPLTIDIDTPADLAAFMEAANG